MNGAPVFYTFLIIVPDGTAFRKQATSARLAQCQLWFFEWCVILLHAHIRISARQPIAQRSMQQLALNQHTPLNGFQLFFGGVSVTPHHQCRGGVRHISV